MSVNMPLLLLPNFGPMEWMVIFGIVLLIFGPQKLPEIADAMGRSIQKFKHAARETREEIESPKPKAPKDDDQE